MTGPGFVTATVAGPTVPVGVVHVMVLTFTTATPVAATPPMLTVAAPAKLAPVMVTKLVTSAPPLLGLMEPTVGPPT